MKKTIIWCGISFFICFALAGCDPKERYEKSVNLLLSINTSQKLVVHTNVGSIKVIGNNTGQADIKAKITGKGDTKEEAQAVAEAIEITVENNGDKVTIKIDKPAAIKNKWFAVDYVINVPEGISLRAGTDVGSITALNIKGDIAASSDVGSIICENVQGKMDLNTDVGNINLAYDTNADGKVNADLSVDVGSLRFKGPENMSAKLDASTDVGSIHSDFPITVQGDICSKKLNGIIGQGEGNVRLKTDVGSITIE